MPSKKKYQRKKFFVDPAVQGAILWQAILFWLLGSFVYLLIISAYRLVPTWVNAGHLTSEDVWFHISPLVMSSATLLPIVLFQAVRFSHRFVGPMVRLRQVLRQLAAGQEVSHVAFRNGDYWQDIAAEINAVSNTMHGLSERLSRREEHEAAASSRCAIEAASIP